MGSGKSTLSRLISGIIPPSEGAILVDGVDVRQIESRYKKNIGIMLQDTWLFSGTIREKHTMGHNEYDDDHISIICKIAGVDDFVDLIQKVMTWKLKKEVFLVARGKPNLARSLIHDPRYFVEPTSSMDQELKRKLLRHLRPQAKIKL